MSEKTLCIIKPDAVENNFVDQINEMIESKGLSILKSKKTNISLKLQSNFMQSILKNLFSMNLWIL